MRLEIKKLFYILIFSIVFFTFPRSLSSENPKNIIFLPDESDVFLSIDSHSIIYRDKDKYFLPEKLLAGEYKDFEVPVKNGYGFTEDCFWIHSIIKNQSKNTDWIFNLDYPLVDSIEVHVFRKKKEVESLYGNDSLPFKERKIKARNYVFRLIIEEEEEIQILTKIITRGTMRFPIYLNSFESYVRNSILEYGAFGSYFSFIILMFIINIIFFLYHKEKAHGVLAIFIFIQGGFDGIQTGFFFDLFEPNHLRWKFPTYVILGIISLICLTYFSHLYLNYNTGKEEDPRLAHSYALLGLIFAFFPFLFPMKIALTALSIYGIVIFIPNTIFIYRLIQTKESHYFHFILAWMVFMISIAIFALRGMGILPSNSFTLYFKEVAIIIVLVFFFVALNTKVKYLSMLVKESEKRKSAEEKVNEANKEMLELNNFSFTINSLSSLREIFIEISKYVYSRYNINAVWLFLPDEEREFLKTYKIYNYKRMPEEQYLYMMNLKVPLKPESGTLNFAFNRKRHIYIPKIKDTSSEVDNEIKRITKVKSFLMVPLICKDKCVGIFAFTNFEDELKLSIREIYKLSHLCAQIAGVIETTYLLQKLNKNKMEIENLNNFVKLVNSTSDVSMILKEVHGFINQSLGSLDLWVLLVNKRKTKLYSDGSTITAPNWTNKNLDFFQEFSMRLNDSMGILYHTYLTKSPLYISDVNQMKSKDKIINEYNGEVLAVNKIDKKIVIKAKAKSIFHFPLLIQTEIIGILALSSHDEILDVNREDLESLIRFADQIAGVLKNAQLLKETEDAKEQAEIEKGIAEIAQLEAETEKRKSDKLLLNILPKTVADELREKGGTEPVLFQSSSILFTDFVGFTKIAETLSPEELIRELDSCFSQFDEIAQRNNLEKIKTIGDSYMCVGGLPEKNNTHVLNSCLAALEIQDFMQRIRKEKETLGLPFWELRIGIHSGPVIAGVIGKNKFAYDVWGDTVNTASRMESGGEPGKINISGYLHEKIHYFFECEYRGKINVKNKGLIDMFFLHRLKKKYSLDEAGKYANDDFHALLVKLKNGAKIIEKKKAVS